MDKLRMQTLDGVQDNIDKIAALFPNCITERKDAEGKVTLAIDFDKLRQELSSEIVEGREERYQFTWPDKKKAILLANSPINATLRPCREESVDFDNTQNLYIEGDNLDVLKCLKETYLGKVKMIYIDPPYNTGNDFVYEDDFAESTSEYLANSGQYDEQGNRLVTNSESNGRFHTDWLNMMYPRLKVARDLLTEDGVIFISINDYEIGNLMKICEEIYGKENELACFCWRTDGNFDNQARIKNCHEYILLFAKDEKKVFLPNTVDPNIPKSSKIFRDEIRNTIIKNGVKNPISDVIIPIGFPSDIEMGFIDKDSIVWPQYNESIKIEHFKTQNKVVAKTGWASKSQLMEFINNNYNPVVDSKGQTTTFVLTKTGAIEAIKQRKNASHVISVLNNMGGTQKATADMGDLGDYFDYPKPVSLIKYLCSMYLDKNDIILDFFSGSATTAHSVMMLNAKDNGKRKFIMVQLPELTYEGKKEKYQENGIEKEKYVFDNKTGYPIIIKDSKARIAGYWTICEIAKERIRYVSNKIKEDLSLTAQSIDTGFRVLKLDSSNMEDIYYSPAEYNQQTLFTKTESVKSDRTSEDLLFQVMLELGATLDSRIEQIEIEDKTIYNVANNYLVACFDNEINDSVVAIIAKMQPQYAVFCDSSMADDSTATNFEQIFKTYSPNTTTKVL